MDKLEERCYLHLLEEGGVLKEQYEEEQKLRGRRFKRLIEKGRDLIEQYLVCELQVPKSIILEYNKILERYNENT